MALPMKPLPPVMRMRAMGRASVARAHGPARYIVPPPPNSKPPWQNAAISGHFERLGHRARERLRRLPMTKTVNALMACALAGVLGGVGCGSQPAAPFDTLKTSNLTAFRLQNYEPPAAATQTPAAAAPGGLTIPGLPPEIQT